jgi:hypothetical protein
VLRYSLVGLCRSWLRVDDACVATSVSLRVPWYAFAMSQQAHQDRPSPNRPTADVVGLYRRAFAEFGGRALWNIREVEAEPTLDQILAITAQLRTEGDMNARSLAEQIEQAARADH